MVTCQNLGVYGHCSFIRCLQSLIIFSFRAQNTSSQTQAEKILSKPSSFLEQKTIEIISALFYFSTVTENFTENCFLLFSGTKCYSIQLV